MNDPRKPNDPTPNPSQGRGKLISGVIHPLPLGGVRGGVFGLLLMLFVCTTTRAQTFTLESVNDSLHYVVLRTDSTEDRWRLPYPVYQFQTGDINGDGLDDCMVGVVKSTRYYPEKARRLFIFKNFHGHVRPMWLGSKLAGTLEDFEFIPPTKKEEKGGTIRATEHTKDGKTMVTDYRWQGFGFCASLNDK